MVALVPVAVDASPAVNEFEKLNELFAAAVAVGICQSVTAPLATVLNPPTKLSAELPPATSKVTPDPEIE